ncbi:bifunctional 23S rRNA (guanine(2069)-N(7))-methyltransferase RlmK/23S rRNA (guanine(2445)-N(2))-methyltransferase RlmL [Aliikangiella sp. G2MR2-5]|uniref:bifunctional 23S rRNA (guanine(2069)-N(7))-methyltransferase RlmK/23S rRNA (guanine(2445)-N(2))-methyltransferase RlmL n=1 Tax=Aliikangiella sp. G2MR2-5 TaxID=2788943 RepID=UPI0018A94723|nr:bifunctional 23S rRNA (guanine(2069)-N(7))-methyltransferase RlmK/23S rRNA (guanine(2445)-N(2))-methyltransferase RlmL [Aliikangiella sp. G2MR2-5]
MPHLQTAIISNMPNFIATCAKGLEYLLVDELVSLGAENISEGLSRASFETDWKGVYEVLMWSRLASRILFPIASFEANDESTLYNQISIIEWQQHIAPGATFVVNSQSYKSKLSHTQFISQRVKDAVVDYYRDNDEVLPQVDFDDPEVTLHCQIRKNQVILSIDLAGRGLHQRGYRVKGGGAPIKENLAAALLKRAKWPGEFKTLVDPMCGSGTFLIEGAMMAMDIAPGLLRESLGLFGWNQFDASLWESIVKHAEERKIKGLADNKLKFCGSDINPKAVRNAQANIALAGLENVIETRIAGVDQLSQFSFGSEGLVIVNPPYSERLGERESVKQLYNELGKWLKTDMKGWKASVLSPDKDFGHSLGIRAQKIYKFNNGSIPCELLNLDLQEKHFIDRLNDDEVDKAFKEKLSPQGVQLCNRVEKNRQKLKKYLASEKISCFRVYDADIPEFNAAIDIYGDKIHIQEYRAPKSIDDKVATRRLKEIQRVAAGVFELPPSQVFVKQRQQQKGSWQYSRQGKVEETQDNFFTIEEGGRKFWVNLKDYLDTGIFLDHRKTRELVANKVSGKKLLNLFCYTGTVSVYAATLGAKTVNVDMSNTYLEWAKRNFKLNRIQLAEHEFIREDCMHWLEQAPQEGEKFDTIFLDPPTFSNSKKMEGHFDVQSDHPKLIEQCLQVLQPKGELIFSNNFQKFEMMVESNERIEVKEITRSTQSPDFTRNNLHRCWLIKFK